ncbi:hypothetical protein BHE74_00033222 [Ensete ventricosum]|nr:hypothetical protein BHE74_00033222 [Ensete ventricosum]
MKMTIPSLVASYGLCHDQVGGLEEPLVLDLEENLYLSRVKGLSLPCVKTRSDTTVGLRRELAMKLSSNSFARESKEEMDDGLSQLYHIRVGPPRVVGKVRHIRESEVS